MQTFEASAINPINPNCKTTRNLVNPCEPYTLSHKPSKSHALNHAPDRYEVLNSRCPYVSPLGPSGILSCADPMLGGNEMAGLHAFLRSKGAQLSFSAGCTVGALIIRIEFWRIVY